MNLQLGEDRPSPGRTLFVMAMKEKPGLLYVNHIGRMVRVVNHGLALNFFLRTYQQMQAFVQLPHRSAT